MTILAWLTQVMTTPTTMMTTKPGNNNDDDTTGTGNNDCTADTDQMEMTNEVF